MSKSKEMRAFHAPDGTVWGVDVQLPGASNAMIVFHHPDGRTARKDRYAWINWRGNEASNVANSVDINKIRAALNDELVRQLFTRSMTMTGERGPAFTAA